VTASHTSRQRRADRRNERAAVITIIALLAIIAFVFFAEGQIGQPAYHVRADVASANGLTPGSPVRVAGVDVGKVTGIAAGPHNTTILSMDIDGAGRPVYRDATITIVPRLVLEGAFYVELDPGSPGEPVLRSGAILPEPQTAIPVQFDQLLGTFTLPTRTALQQTLQGLAQGLGAGRGGAPSGTSGLRATVRAFAASLPAVGAGARASQGTSVGDLHRMVDSLRDLTTGFAAHPVALSGLVGHFNRLVGDFAAESAPLSHTVTGLDAVLRTATPSLTALNTALPEVGRFGRAIDPALRAAPGPLRAGIALLNQLRGLSSPAELPALLQRTSPASHTLPQLETRLIPLVNLTTRADLCISHNVVPALNQEVPDGKLSTGDPGWLDMFHAFTAITSVTGGFDGNGAAVRTGLVGSLSELSGILPGLGAFAGIGPAIQGVRPTWLGYNVNPPYRPDVWCDTQPLPDLGDRSGPAPEWARNSAPLNLSLLRASR
jgi:phospholipid/cholesterol/gamma-HCH transport system substrate-binding protein